MCFLGVVLVRGLSLFIKNLVKLEQTRDKIDDCGGAAGYCLRVRTITGHHSTCLVGCSVSALPLKLQRTKLQRAKAYLSGRRVATPDALSP